MLLMNLTKHSQLYNVDNLLGDFWSTLMQHQGV